jgi:succinylglutamate desuccinylase
VTDNKTITKVDEIVEFEDDPAIPSGWQKLVKDLKHKARQPDGKNHIIYVEESFGSLECSCQLSAFSDQAFMIDLHNIRRKSQHTCFGCGSNQGTRVVMNKLVEIYCDDCLEKVLISDKVSNKTNTWLDSF